MRSRYLFLGLLVSSQLVSCSKKDSAADISNMIRGLKDERPDVRGPAQIGLISTGAPAALPVAELLNDPEPRIRLSAAQTLWSLGANARAATPQIIAALGDSSPGVRANAAMALELIGPDAVSAVPALVKCLHDVDWNVRQHAAMALGGIGPGAKSAVPALQRAAQDEFTRSAATEAMQKIH
jgi:HEAT repeat protein